MQMSHNSLNHESGARSYMSTLPNELLCKIFLHGTQAWARFTSPLIPFPVLVANVCTHWHDVAHGMPVLWTFILPPMHRLEFEECVQWTLAWLERSKPHLVAVVLDCLISPDHSTPRKVGGRGSTKAPKESDPERFVKKILHILAQAPISHRLRQVDIRSWTSGPFKQFVQDLEDAPHLEQLSVYPTKKTHSQGVSFTIDLSEINKWGSLKNARRSLPCLKRLAFRGVSPPVIYDLTSLTIHRLRLDYNEAKALFRSSPRLAQLVLPDLRASSRPALDSVALIEVPSLRSLAVEVTEIGRGGKYFLSWLHFPNLEYVEVNRTINERVFFSESTIASVMAWTSSTDSIWSSPIAWSPFFATRPSSPIFNPFLPFPPPVKKLRIVNTDFSGVDLKFYHSLSCLEELELIEVPVKELLWQESTEPPDWRRTYHRNTIDSPHHSPSINKRQSYDVSENSDSVDPPLLLPVAAWPALKRITADKLSTQSLVHLIRYVQARASSEESIQSIHLSQSCLYRLEHEIRRSGSTVFVDSQISADQACCSAYGKADVKDWLKDTLSIEIELLQGPGHGLLNVAFGSHSMAEMFQV